MKYGFGALIQPGFRISVHRNYVYVMIDMVIDEQTTDEFARPVCHSAKDQHGLGIGNSNARRGGLDQFSEFVGGAGPVVLIIRCVPNFPGMDPASITGRNSVHEVGV